MAINVDDIRNRTPDVEVEGTVEFEPTEVEDETDAMIVGPAERGPLFVPTEVRTREQFRQIFGSATTYSSYSALEVLRQTDRVNFTRVIATDGWDPSPVVIFGSGGTDFPHFISGGGNPLAVLIFSDRYQRITGADPSNTRLLKSRADQNKIAQDFTLQTLDSQGDLVDEFRLSLNPFSPRYIERVLPPDIRIYQNFRESQRAVLADTDEETLVTLGIFDEDSPFNPLSFDTFDAPRTPWILSQEVQAGQRNELFRISVRSDGEAENRRFKVSISDIGANRSESGWKTFNLALRDFDDTDLNQNVIEQYENLSLNPQDQNYIAKVIGTEFKEYDFDSRRIQSFGGFEQQSLNIRVEVSSQIRRADPDTVPFGFAPYKQTFTQSSQVPVFRTERSFNGRLLDYLNVNSVANPRGGQGIEESLHFGIDFQVEQNENFFQGIPKGAQEVGEAFKLDEFIDPVASDLEERKFSLGFQGGSDGQSIYRERFKGANIRTSNTFGFDFDGKFSGGQDAYRRAYDLLSEVEGGFKFNLLTTPELDFQNHNRSVREAEEMVRGRGDAFYVFDGYPIDVGPSEAERPNLQSSYAATYFNWIAPIEGEFDFVPPSAVVAQTYAQSDSIQDPWFAPAGIRRGEIPRVEEVNTRITEEELDRLYELQVNPITFSDANGILFLGNKTLEPNLDSLLSSIDVRRTLVFIISEVRNTAADYLFEQNDPETVQNFRADIQRILATLQARGGIREYEVEVSDPTDLVEQRRRPNTITASVSVIPQPSSEYITVDFVIQEQSINVIG